MRGKKNKLPVEVPPLQVWTRDQWNALPPVESSPPLEHPIHYLTFTHTQTPPCNTHEECVKILQDLQKKHIEQGMTDIQFHWMVGGGGNAYEGRGWYTQTVNTEPKDLQFQGKTLNVAFIGNYPDRHPPEVIFKTAGNLLLIGNEQKMFHADLLFILHHIKKPPKQIRQPKQPKLQQKKKTEEEKQEESAKRRALMFNIKTEMQAAEEEQLN